MIAKLVAFITVMVASWSVVPATDASPSGTWSRRADRAIAAFAKADTGAAGPFAYAYMASAVARQSTQGWSDPQALGYLDRVLAYRQADNGWGLTREADVYGDGTWNTVDTTYTVTLTDHVGPVLLEAYAAGKVPRDVIDGLAAELLSISRSTSSTGTCIAYSDSPNDAGQPCVHNVNASTGLFLTQLQTAGFVTGQDDLIAAITRREVAAYDPRTHFWPLWDGGVVNDWDHNALDAEAMLTLSPAIGNAVVDYMVVNFGDHSTPLAHTRLAQFRCNVLTGGFDEYLRTAGGSTQLIRYAQLARWAALATDACPYRKIGPLPTPRARVWR